MVQNMNANLKVLSEHVPDVFDGDAVIFSAERSGNGSFLTENWRPYIAGDVTLNSVDCTHYDMLSPESLSLYGEQLQCSLAETQRSQHA